MRTFAKILIVSTLLVAATALVAQTTSYDIKHGTVVAAYNNKLVVKMATGETKEFDVPAGFKFNIDGREMGLSELQPGMELTSVVKTTHTPHTVRTVDVKEGEVLRVVGSTLYVRTNGENKAIKVPTGFKFLVDGKQVGLEELRPGYKLSAEIVTTSEKTVTDREVRIGGTTPPPPPAPAPAYTPAPAPEPIAEKPKLPKTASVVPAIGLLGLALTAGGLAIGRRS